ncbi:MAG: hypothetical protein O3A46_11880 [Candidatus Poribacteria bacterium]|nr:hypothetical protein [Candidatus Poribacteria bacterium]
MRALQSYTWQGNVRQIENVIERAVIVAHGNVITHADLPAEFVGDTSPSEAVQVPVGIPFEEVKSLVFRAALKRTNGNKELAARLLNISARTLYRWLREQNDGMNSSL